MGIIGAGAVGGVIARALTEGRVEHAELAGVVAGRDAGRQSFDALLESCNVMVEAASQAAVVEYGPEVKRANIDLIVVSIGALADDDLLRVLSAPFGGRLLLSTGACGGIDLLRAAHLLEPLDTVRLQTTKPGAALVRDWMEPQLQQKLRKGQDELSVFVGTAREAARRFPETANLAALIALATVGLDAMEVEVRAGRSEAAASHEISAAGRAGTYRFLIQNTLSPNNMRTSAVTGYAVLRGLADARSMFAVGW